MREDVILECMECKRRNYTTTKAKNVNVGRVEYKKYCRFCKKRVVHKETK